jgi:hypothetical protein
MRKTYLVATLGGKEVCREFLPADMVLCEGFLIYLTSLDAARPLAARVREVTIVHPWGAVRYVDIIPERGTEEEFLALSGWRPVQDVHALHGG